MFSCDRVEKCSSIEISLWANLKTICLAGEKRLSVSCRLINILWILSLRRLLREAPIIQDVSAVAARAVAKEAAREEISMARASRL